MYIYMPPGQIYSLRVKLRSFPPPTLGLKVELPIYPRHPALF